MSSVLEMQLSPAVNTGPAPTADREEQATHSASPNDFNKSTGSNAKTVVLALVGFVAVIYILHALGRAVS
jgi:hypothetical protein